MGHMAGVYIGPSYIAFMFRGQWGASLGIAFPGDTCSSIQGRNFKRRRAFHAFLGCIYSGWGQGRVEACGMAFFNLAMLSDAPGCRGGAMVRHSILNLNLYVYDNSSWARAAKLHVVATKTFPVIKWAGLGGGSRAGHINLQANHKFFINEFEISLCDL